MIPGEGPEASPGQSSPPRKLGEVPVTNQDHNTPVEADERVLLDPASSATGEVGFANGEMGSGGGAAGPGADQGRSGDDGGFRDEVGSGVDQSGSDSGGPGADGTSGAEASSGAGEAQDEVPGETSAVSVEASHGKDPEQAEPTGTPYPAVPHPAAPSPPAPPSAPHPSAPHSPAPPPAPPPAPHPSAPHPSARYPSAPYDAAAPNDAAPAPTAQPEAPGYPVAPQYGYGGQTSAGHREPGRHRPVYEPHYYEYGQSYADPSLSGNSYAYADPGMPYGDVGPTYAGAGNAYVEQEHGWQQADQGRYPAASRYAGDHPGTRHGAEQPEATLGGYPNAPAGHGDADALAPLPPRRTDKHARETAESLTPESLLPTKKPAPAPGWRRAVYRMTGGLIRPGESHAELRRRELIYRVRTPVAGGHHRVAVMSLKGGVGKTTTAVGLGAILASLRGDRVIAVDANPDRGTLSDKVRLETAATVRDLLHERAQIQRYADVRAFTSQAPSRLELLASDRDPAVSVAFSETDYYDVAGVLEHYYSICITDCGTGLLHSAMAGVLQLADQIVLVSSPSVDGARSASATLDWLDAHDYGDLVRNAVVVLSIIRPRGKSTIDLDRLEQHFAGRCRAVARIPFDPHLEEGAEVDLELMNPETADAYLMLAATVGDGFAWPRRVRVAVT